MSIIMKKLKNSCHFFNIDHTEKFQITTPPKDWISGFPSVDRNGISVFTIMKKLKNGCHFFNIDHMEKFQITDPHKVWVSSFLLIRKLEMQIFFFFEFSIGLFFLITHPRFHFNIYAWLHLKHLCMDIYASLVYPLSHLCVFLHFLIFV